MAGWRETETLKPIDKVSFGEITSHRAVMRVNAKWPRNHMNPRAELTNEGRRQRCPRISRYNIHGMHTSYEHYDEPETLPSSIHPFYPISADGGQLWVLD